MVEIIDIKFTENFKKLILNLQEIEKLKDIENIISNNEELVNFNLSEIHSQVKSILQENDIETEDDYINYNQDGIKIAIFEKSIDNKTIDTIKYKLSENWRNIIESYNKENLIIVEGVIENIEVIEMSEEEYNNTYVYDIGVEGNHNFFAENVLVHNCHHLPASTMNEVAKKASNAYYRIGVSATPWRDGGDDLLIEAVLAKRKPEFSINASKLIELGFLVPCTIYFVPIKQVFPGKNYQKLYKKAIVENEERNNAIVKIAHKMLIIKQTTTLILIQHVAHGEILQNKLLDLIPEESFTVSTQDPKSGKWTLVRVKNVEFLSGQDDAIRRRAVIQAAKEKKVKILIGSTIADEGLDVPPLDCLILAGGGRSSTRAYQRVGRVLRLYTDPNTGIKKDKALVFDFVDFTPTLRRHSRVREKLYLAEPAWNIKFFNPELLNE